MIPLSRMAGVSILIAVGASAGVHLGESAIAEINPIYLVDATNQLRSGLEQMANSTWSGEVASPAPQPVYPMPASCIACGGSAAETTEIQDLPVPEDSSAPPILPIFHESEAHSRSIAVLSSRHGSHLAMIEGYDRYPQVGGEALHASIDVGGEGIADDLVTLPEASEEPIHVSEAEQLPSIE